MKGIFGTRNRVRFTENGRRKRAEDEGGHIKREQKGAKRDEKGWLAKTLDFRFADIDLDVTFQMQKAKLSAHETLLQEAMEYCATS